VGLLGINIWNLFYCYLLKG